METAEFTELSARCEAVIRVTLHMAACLEEAEVIDGHRLQEAMFGSKPTGSPLSDRMSQLMCEMEQRYSQARSTRRSKALWLKNRTDPTPEGSALE